MPVVPSARLLLQPASRCRSWRGLLVGSALTLLIADARASDGTIVSAPLSPPSGPRSGPLFSELSPDSTGIIADNAYADPQMWWELHQEFKFGAIGSGVAIGDADGDGRPDVFVVSKTHGGRLFRNLGDWRFEDVTASAGLTGAPTGVWDQGMAWARRLLRLDRDPTAPVDGVWYQGATFADVNNDGWLDLYVCRFGAPNLLYVNQGDGTFQEEAAARGLALADASGQAAFADYDRDGWLDVYLQTNLLNVSTSPTGQRDRLYRNRGDGTFVDVTETAGISGLNQGHSATWWDYDGDGWPDLYVANDFAPPDQLYRNNRDGTFTNVIDQVVPTMPHSAMGADLGDVNNDGLVDLLVADMAATTREKDQRTMARIRSLLNESPEDADEAPQFMRNTLFVNTGTGLMLEAGILAGLAATDWTWSVRLEDFDNDGWLDAFFTNGMVRELHNADLVQRIAATENIAEGVRLLRDSPPLAERNLAFRNEGDLRFTDVSADWGLHQFGVTFGAASGDLDGDGDLDLVLANYEQGPTVLRNDSDSGRRLIVALRGTKSNRFGVGAVVKIETDGGQQIRPLVLARGYLSNSEPILHFGLGPHERVHRLTVYWPSGYEQGLTDLAADHRYTITEPAAAASAVPARTTQKPIAPLFAPIVDQPALLVSMTEAPLPPSAQQPLLPFRQHRRGPAAAAGDLNGDGRTEIVLGGTTVEPTRLLRRSAEGRWSERALVSPGPVNDGPIVIFDANGDDHLDLLVTRSGVHQPAGSTAYQPQLWIGDGRGEFSRAPADTLPALPISAGAAVSADFDRDGRLDLFVGGRVLPGQYPRSPRSALLRNVGGRFEDVTDTLAPDLREPGLVTGALWTDVDNDGWVDLLVALEWGGVRYWRNEDGQRFVDRSVEGGFASAGTGWWTSLLGADFNGDGRLDYVAGNVGLNTPYAARPGDPVTLLYGSVRDGGPLVLLETLVDGGRLFPRRSRNELTPHLGALLRRFPSNDAFARASVLEILGEDRLSEWQRVAVNELRSGIFLSRDDGRHEFQPLPRLAQIAPVQGMAAGDFDGDGMIDLLVAHNSHAPIPSLGRFAGGLGQLLRGDGRGGFEPVSAQASGLVVPGDAKAVVALALAGDTPLDLFITRNDDTTLAFRHQPTTPSRALRVTLTGPAGNPQALGARVTLDVGMTTSSTEVYGGGGYMSQSAPTLLLPRRTDTSATLHVRWPDGAVTEHAVRPGQREIEASAPR